MSFTTFGGMIFFLLLINVEFGSQVQFILASVGTGAFTAFTGANVKPLIMEITTPDIRGTAFAWFSLADDLGKGLGPFVISLLISGMGSR